jgi:hypothetical protein
MSKFVSSFGDDDQISDELYLFRLRFWRDAELSKTDYTQLPDSPVNKPAWATYRQALRDLPASNSDPRAIELPIAP